MSFLVVIIKDCQQINCITIFETAYIFKCGAVRNSSFRPLRSGQRFLVPLAKRFLHKHSFIPSAIQILNSGQRKK